MLDWIKEHRTLLWALLVGDLIVLLVRAGFLLQQESRRGVTDTALSDSATFITRQSLADTNNGGSAVVGQPAPDFTLKPLDGGEVTLSTFQGRLVLINFWASWCAPCRVEMPDLVRAYEAHKADGLVVLAINATAQDSIADVRAFVKEFNMPFPVLLDETGTGAREYSLRGLPMSIFIDRKGMIVRRQLGAMTSEQIDAFVAEILQ